MVQVETMSGVDVLEKGKQHCIRKGAADAIRVYVDKLGGTFPLEVTETVENVSRYGGTPLVVSDNAEVLGVVYLKDVVKGGIKERFAQLRKMGIRTVMLLQICWSMRLFIHRLELKLKLKLEQTKHNCH